MDNSRRITKPPFPYAPLASGETSPKLKNLAGLIQGLTYSEMREFSTQLTTKINEGTKELPEILLDVSAEILSK